MNCEHLEQQLAELPLYGYFFLKTGELTFTDRRGTDLKDGAREAAAVYDIGFNDPDVSGRGVVIIRGDCNGR